MFRALFGLISSCRNLDKIVAEDNEINAHTDSVDIDPIRPPNKVETNKVDTNADKINMNTNFIGANINKIDMNSNKIDTNKNAIENILKDINTGMVHKLCSITKNTISNFQLNFTGILWENPEAGT